MLSDGSKKLRRRHVQGKVRIPEGEKYKGPEKAHPVVRGFERGANGGLKGGLKRRLGPLGLRGSLLSPHLSRVPGKKKRETGRGTLNPYTP